MKSILESIGNTPLLRLERLPDPGGAEVFVKWEGANPTGSMKDRMALSMVEGAERRGLLKPGGTVIDYTGGSTGSSLAMVCAAKGYKSHFVSSDAFAEEKLQTMRTFGAKLELIRREPGGPTWRSMFSRDFTRVPGWRMRSPRRCSRSPHHRARSRAALAFKTSSPLESGAKVLLIPSCRSVPFLPHACPTEWGRPVPGILERPESAGFQSVERTFATLLPTTFCAVPGTATIAPHDPRRSPRR